MVGHKKQDLLPRINKLKSEKILRGMSVSQKIGHDFRKSTDKRGFAKIRIYLLFLLCPLFDSNFFAEKSRSHSEDCNK